MKRKLIFSCLAILLSHCAIAFSSESEADFFQKAQGTWAGPGEIVAGKYKGTKFQCVFDGVPTETKVGVAMNGKCRIGVFNEEMKARIEKVDGTYKGSFLDGAKGKGLDVISGRVSENRVTLSLLRNQLNGSMIADMTSNNSMNVNISVKVNNHSVPVISMTLKRAATSNNQLTENIKP